MFSFTQWLSQHWFDAAQTAGIVAGLAFTAASFRDAKEAQKIANLFTLTQYQRELFSDLFNRPELRRTFSAEVDLASQPVTEDERLFLTMVILHLNLAVAAIQSDAIIPVEGLERDLAEMFNKPIPRAVWKEIRSVQNRDVRVLLDRLTNVENLN